MRGSIINLLKKIFLQSGYSVEQSYEYDLIAEKLSDKVFVKYSEDMDWDDVDNFSNDAINRDGLFLMVSSESLSSGISDIAESKGIVIWDRNEFETQIGRAILAEVEGKMSNLTLSKAKESQSYDFPSTGFMNFFDNERVEASNAPSYESNRPPPFYESNVAPSYESNVEAVSEANTELKLNTLPIDIDKLDALAIAKRQIRDAQINKIRFIPFWTYDYLLDQKKRYKSKIIDLSGQGTYEINALTGSISNRLIMFKDHVCDKISVPEERYSVEKPALTKDEIEQVIINKIMKDHTKIMKFSEEEGQAIVYEDKVFRPSLDDISLFSELIYLPVWEIEGSNGLIEINAFSGEEIDFPIDDDAEFV